MAASTAAPAEDIAPAASLSKAANVSSTTPGNDVDRAPAASSAKAAIVSAFNRERRCTSMELGGNTVRLSLVGEASKNLPSHTEDESGMSLTNLNKRSHDMFLQSNIAATCSISACCVTVHASRHAALDLS
jgi:hypothetical protein